MKCRGMFHQKRRGLAITRLMKRDGEDCSLCGFPLDRHIRDETHPRYITFDHVVPRSRGGLDTLQNLQLAHRECNMARGNDPMIEEAK